MGPSTVRTETVRKKLTGKGIIWTWNRLRFDLHLRLSKHTTEKSGRLRWAGHLATVGKHDVHIEFWCGNTSRDEVQKIAWSPQLTFNNSAFCTRKCEDYGRTVKYLRQSRLSADGCILRDPENRGSRKSYTEKNIHYCSDEILHWQLLL